MAAATPCKFNLNVFEKSPRFTIRSPWTTVFQESTLDRVDSGMSSITTHVMDAVAGRPGSGIAVRLDKREGNSWVAKGVGATHTDGHCRGLALRAPKGFYRLVFRIEEYLARHGRQSDLSEISVTFHCDGTEHYHMPILLSDDGYTALGGCVVEPSQ